MHIPAVVVRLLRKRAEKVPMGTPVYHTESVERYTFMDFKHVEVWKATILKGSNQMFKADKDFERK